MDLKRFFLYSIRLRKLPKGRVVIGSHCSGTPWIYSQLASDNVTIGNFCSIGPDVMIIPSTGHIPLKEFQKYRISTFPLAELKGWKSQYWRPFKGGEKPIMIGSDVWIGTRAIILPEVSIGDGAIIGAGAVVADDVPPFGIVAGVPAKLLRYRFTETQISKLLEIKWWNWSDAKIAENLDYFYDDIDKFIEKFSLIIEASPVPKEK